jgi:hypothetical protein
MRPQSCKAKGRRFQQQIVRDLLERFPHLTEDDVKSCSMGANGEDVQLSAAARMSIPFSFEAKNQERCNVWAALEQAKANAPAGTEVVVAIKKNKAVPHVLISWDCFLNLIARPDAAQDAAPPSKRQRLERLADDLRRLSAEIEE